MAQDRKHGVVSQADGLCALMRGVNKGAPTDRVGVAHVKLAKLETEWRHLNQKITDFTVSLDNWSRRPLSAQERQSRRELLRRALGISQPHVQSVAVGVQAPC